VAHEHRRVVSSTDVPLVSHPDKVSERILAASAEVRRDEVSSAS
jgi:hypothetical protein